MKYLVLGLLMTLFSGAITKTAYAVPPLSPSHTKGVHPTGRTQEWIPGHYAPGHYVYYSVNGFRRRHWVFGHWVQGHYAPTSK